MFILEYSNRFPAFGEFTFKRLRFNFYPGNLDIQ